MSMFQVSDSSKGGDSPSSAVGGGVSFSNNGFFSRLKTTDYIIIGAVLVTAYLIIKRK